MSPPSELNAPLQTSFEPPEHEPGGSGWSTCSPVLTCPTDLLTSKLPSEIISEIFSQICDVDNAADSTYDNTTLAPLRLSHVSHQWREVAHLTPKLWTHLMVIVRRSDIYRAVELIKLWVPRCKHRPQKIDVIFKDEHGPFVLFPEDSLNSFRSVTKTAVVFRRDFQYKMDKAYFETHIKSGCSGALPFIEEKYFWYHGVTTAPRKEELTNIPLLVRGVRRAVDEFGFGHHEPLSSSLTRLELLDTNGVTCLSSTELLIILAEFTQLRYFSAFLDHGDTPPAEEVVAANVLTFKLAWAYTTDPGGVFDNLRAPSIAEMELSGDVPSGAPWNHLYDFFQRSRPPIRTLALEHFDTTAAASRMTDCLAMCNALESLWIENCIVDNDLLASLGRRSALAEDSVLSRLRILGLVSAEDFTGECLVQTLRNAETGKLKELFIFDCDGVLQEHCDALDELSEGSVSISTIIVSPGDPVE